MTPRFDAFKDDPHVIKALVGLETAIADGGLGAGLSALVRLRASQLNDCSYCVYMHINEGLKAGETRIRLDLVAAWRDSPLFSEEEQAALAWTEVVTRSQRPTRLTPTKSAPRSRASCGH